MRNFVKKDMPTAYFLMNIAINHQNEVIRKIKDVFESDVMLDYEIQGSFGIYDLVLKLDCKINVIINILE